MAMMCLGINDMIHHNAVHGFQNDVHDGAKGRPRSEMIQHEPRHGTDAHKKQGPRQHARHHKEIAQPCLRALYQLVCILDFRIDEFFVATHRPNVAKVSFSIQNYERRKLAGDHLAASFYRRQCPCSQQIAFGTQTGEPVFVLQPLTQAVVGVATEGGK